MSISATTLADFTLPALMVSEVDLADAREVVGNLCEGLERAGRVPDARSFFDAVMRREKICSTVGPEGWALPHARMEGLKRLSFAVARAGREIDWLESGGQRVRMVFLFAVPEGDMCYLRLIAGVARLTQDASRMAELLAATDAGGMFEVFRAFPMPSLADSPPAKV